MIDELIAYFKNPVLEKDENKKFSYRFGKFVRLLLISIATTFILTIITSIFEASGLLKQGEHSLENVFKNATTLKLFLLAVIFAPITEELIFRAPLTLFKKPNIFRIAFYSIALLFGYIHLWNYEISLNIILFSPVLIAPQIIIGLYLGFIRIRFGLAWSIALHASYNGVLLLLYLLATNAITQS